MKRFAMLMVLMVCLSLTAFAAAEVPAGDVFGGFQIMHSGGTGSTTFYGWDASAAFNFHPMISAVADFGGTYKTISGTKVKGYNYLFGPRANFRQDKVTYFGEALFGGVHGSAASVSNNEFAMAYGGGVDVKAGKMMIRVIEFDWVPVKNSGTGGGWAKKNTRYNFGVVFPFGKK